MLVQVIIERLRLGLETQSVFGAAEFQFAVEETGYTETPSYFVIPQSETAATYEDDDYFLVSQVIQVVAMTELKTSDFRGEAAFYDARSERKNIFSQVLGWVPDRQYEATRYQSGALLSADAKRVFYGYNFLFTEQVDPACDGFQGQLEWDEDVLRDPSFMARAINA